MKCWAASGWRLVCQCVKWRPYVGQPQSVTVESADDNTYRKRRVCRGRKTHLSPGQSIITWYQVNSCSTVSSHFPPCLNATCGNALHLHVCAVDVVFFFLSAIFDQTSHYSNPGTRCYLCAGESNRFTYFHTCQFISCVLTTRLCERKVPCVGVTPSYTNTVLMKIKWSPVQVWAVRGKQL